MGGFFGGGGESTGIRCYDNDEGVGNEEPELGSGDKSGGREVEDIDNGNVNQNGHEKGPEGDSSWPLRTVLRSVRPGGCQTQR